jgi:predicted nucleic acid-binding Zn ribbon protein
MPSKNPEDGLEVKPKQSEALRRPRTANVGSSAGNKNAHMSTTPAAQDDPSGYRPPVMRGANPLARVLENVINPMESSARIHESLALAYWPRVAGAQAAAATQVDQVRDGVLIVRTKSAVWSHELTLHKARLLQGLNRMLGGKFITDILFRAQGLNRPEVPADPETPTAEELAAVPLEQAEKIELRARLQALITIPDDRVRQAIATRIVQETRLRHWRLEHGWQTCTRCQAVHNTDYRLCPICRLGKS